MNLEEIRKAIFLLSEDERRRLIDSLVVRRVPVTKEQRERMRDELRAIPEDEWIDWDQLREELVE